MTEIDYFQRIRDIAPMVDYDRDLIPGKYLELYGESLPDTLSIKMTLLTVVPPATSTYVGETAVIPESSVVTTDTSETSVVNTNTSETSVVTTVIEDDDDVTEFITEKVIDAVKVPKQVSKSKPGKTVINCRKLNELRPKTGAAKPDVVTTPMKDYGVKTTKDLKDCIVMAFDVETERKKQKFTDENGVEVVFDKVLIELAYQKYTNGKLLEQRSMIVNVPKIKVVGTGIHRITNEIMTNEGLPIDHVLDRFVADIADVDIFIGHNVQFDINVMLAELYMHNRINAAIKIKSSDIRCTMAMFSQSYLCKRTSLTQVYNTLFSTELEPKHIALFDVQVCADIFHEMSNI